MQMLNSPANYSIFATTIGEQIGFKAENKKRKLTSPGRRLMEANFERFYHQCLSITHINTHETDQSRLLDSKLDILR